jgi:hypothetical protein
MNHGLPTSRPTAQRSGQCPWKGREEIAAASSMARRVARRSAAELDRCRGFQVQDVRVIGGVGGIAYLVNADAWDVQ